MNHKTGQPPTPVNVAARSAGSRVNAGTPTKLPNEKPLKYCRPALRSFWPSPSMSTPALMT